MIGHVIALPHENVRHLVALDNKRLVLLQEPAHTPEEAENQERNGPRWNHPQSGYAVIDGLRFHAYSGDWRKRRACFWSHFALWEVIADAGENEPRMILESDTVFIRDFDPDELDCSGFGMVSLNDPRGATRRADRYHAALQQMSPHLLQPVEQISEVPWIDDRAIPQGLPGMSAYVIWPWFAQELLDKVAQVGAMPNDALVNRQWFPGKLGCLTNYATKVSGRPSTLA